MSDNPVLHRLFQGLLISLVSLVLAGCTTVNETGRKQLNMFSPGEEMQLGFGEFDKMKKEVPISHDPKANEAVQRVGRRIAAVANLPDAQWEFVVFDSKEANAFCLPGGKVGVYTGIFPLCRDDAGLATVLGHEVAHAVARHGGERMTTAYGIQAGGQLAGALLGSSKYANYGPLFTQVYGVGSQVGVALPHSRLQESEADQIGLSYMARAGYDPANAIGFWERFRDYNAKQGGATLWLLRTHPTDDQRISDLKRLLPQAQAQFHPQ
ncbi:MAG TPA: M48 family metallopeptidase [Candidatus Limnocylindria bacterium]|nr:M48 family metallopeptidase [Candidatus Limnocylindria bacterium]